MSFNLRTALPSARPLQQSVTFHLRCPAPALIRRIPLIPRRTITAAPRTGSGPLLERRADRALPDLRRPRLPFLISLPIFLTILGISTLTIFNYQKQSSSVVSSTLYALRTNPLARSLLGDEIQFKSYFPWIHGDMDQFHGNIDIQYDVKGTKGEGRMRFKCTRNSRLGLFETEVWELVLKDGRTVNLLVATGEGEGRGGQEPFPRERQATV